MPAPKNVVDYLRQLSNLVYKSEKRLSRRSKNHNPMPLPYPTDMREAFNTKERLRREKYDIAQDVWKYAVDKYVKECMENHPMWHISRCRQNIINDPLSKVNILDQLIELDPVDFMEANSNYVRRKANRLITGEED